MVDYIKSALILPRLCGSGIRCRFPIGADDFAFRSGQRYGGLAVNPERRLQMIFLPDSEAVILSVRLKVRPRPGTSRQAKTLRPSRRLGKPGTSGGSVARIILKRRKLQSVFPQVAIPNRVSTNFACPCASLPLILLTCPFLIMLTASIPSSGY